LAVAIRRPVRKKARVSVQAVRREREALKRCRKGRGIAGDPEASGLNLRLQPLADYVLDAGYFDTAWDIFRFGHLKGLDHDEAALLTAAWARDNRIVVEFDVRVVRNKEVVFLILRPRLH
jgi:hypothetical protein